MDCLPSPGTTGTASSLSGSAGASPIITVSFEAKLISGSFDP